MNIKALFTSTLAELTSQMKLTPQEEDKLWYEFLDFLHKENSHFGRYFIRQANLQGEFIEQIKDQIDVDIDDIEDITEDDNYWNKSIKSLCEKFLEYKQKIENQENIKFGKNNLEIAELKNSDAGADFSNEGEWVKPVINIDGELYSEIRGLDKVISALTNYMCMQFTNTQLQEDNSLNERGSWLRLIMPQYSRRVEIEDLNRNFWVIAQTTSAVCSWLFDEDNSVLSLLNGILSEISQLWENVVYLWAALALKNQKQNYYIHTEMINIDEIPYLLPGGIQYNEIQEKIEYLKDKYNQNLCIIPYTKHIYKHNYYDNIIIPAIYLYHQGTKEWNVIKFNTPIQIDINDILSDKIYALREDDYEMNYEYGAPYSEIKNLYGPNEAYFYGALRVYPDFKFILTSTSLKLQEEDGYCKGGFKVYDAARTATEGEVNRVLTVKIKSDGTYYFNYVNGSKIDNIDFKYREPQYCNNSLYLGEVISKREKSAAAEIKDAEFKVVKIGDFYPISIFGTSSDEAKNINDESLRRKFHEVPKDDNPYDSKKYDWATYGIGGQYITDNLKTTGRLIFANYNFLYENNLNDKLIFAEDLSSEKITELSLKYIKHLREDIHGSNIEPLLIDDVRADKAMIYAVKIGVTYWEGASGSQWNSGIVTDFIYVHKVKNQWQYDSLAKPYLFDGYWIDVSAPIWKVDNGRWRRLFLGCDSMRITRENGKYVIKNIQNGKIVWYDHNNEEMTEEQRPRGTMNSYWSEEKNENIIYFSNFINPYYSDDENKKMATLINRLPDQAGKTDIFFIDSSGNTHYGIYDIGNGNSEEDAQIKFKRVYKGGFVSGTLNLSENGLKFGGVSGKGSDTCYL